ncbi:MAG: NAD(P)-dependent oxidoreductase [Coriobacteriia bacterium]|nr:NAD(P)-dependent oxidoreductase [Coriobacteriia bacterium]
MSENKRIWITGAKGYLGQALSKRLADAGYDVIGSDRNMDIGDFDRLEAFAQEIRPHAVINCAGVRRDATSLSARFRAYEANALGARNVALAAEGVGAITVQVSSDDVYSAKTLEPVNEFDTPNADTPYGKSKRAGEAMVRDTTERHIILRTSWLYRKGGGRLQNLLQAAEAGTTIPARTDQYAAPTSIKTYTEFLIKVLNSGKFGTFNIATQGKCNRYEFASKALELCGYDPAAVLVATEDPATAESVILEGIMNEIAGIMPMPTWEQDLEDYLKSQGLTK